MSETEPLNVRVFELMGAEWVRDSLDCYHWKLPDGKSISDGFFCRSKQYNLLPDIHENFQLTLDWLVPFMRGNGYESDTNCFHLCQQKPAQFRWVHFNDKGGMTVTTKEDITNDNYAKAACLAAIPILEKIKEEKG